MTDSLIAQATHHSMTIFLFSTGEIMFDEILNNEELYQLTQKKKSSAQSRVLDYLHIKYSERPNGTLIVYRRDALKLDAKFEPAERKIDPYLMARINGQATRA